MKRENRIEPIRNFAEHLGGLERCDFRVFENLLKRMILVSRKEKMKSIKQSNDGGQQK